MSGSFLKSSLLNGHRCDRFFCGAAAVSRRTRFWRGAGVGCDGGGGSGLCRSRRRRSPFGGRFGLDELDLRVRMAEFGQLGLQQRVVARVVHQAEVVRELRIEADGEDVLRERNRMRFEQVAAGERAGPADGLDHVAPRVVPRSPTSAGVSVHAAAAAAV